MHAAAVSGHVNVIKALLNKGAHIEARTKVMSFLVFTKHVQYLPLPFTVVVGVLMS